MEKKLYVVHTMLAFDDEQSISSINACTYDRAAAERVVSEERKSWFRSGGIFEDYEEESGRFCDEGDVIPAECRDMEGGRCAICDIETVVFYTLVFTFSADVYDREDVERMTVEECHGFAMNDPQNVRKYSEGIQSLLNGDLIDTENCWIRVFE